VFDHLAPTPVTPEPDKTSAFFWEGARQHRLLIQSCTNCGFLIHTPQPVCRRCLSFALSAKEMSGDGTVYSYTEVGQSMHPSFADAVPYILSVVELREQPGLRLVSNLVECGPGEARVGMQVTVSFRAVSNDTTLPVFRPAVKSQRVR
jgi:uncharacterized OB-fold protein